MNCFPCFSKGVHDEEEETTANNIPVAQPKDSTPPPPPKPSSPPGSDDSRDPFEDSRNAEEAEDCTCKSFTFREIATATKNFRQECLLGEGGFGKVFRGTLQGSGQVVAVRSLERNTGGKDFVFEISNLSLLRHPNLVKMVGYCGEGEQRHLVYEYIPSGSLTSYLFDLEDGKKALDWSERMKIAYGIAAGLEYLHEKADPTVIYRDLRSSNVLLTETKDPKLADYGLAKIVQGGNTVHMSVMTGFNGYCAPEFEKNGDLTVKSDVYSFGVVLLELITGRKALDTSLPPDEQSLVAWAQPLFKNPAKFPEMADPRLRKGFPVTGLNQAVGIAAMCIQEEPIARPLISDISAAINFLAMAPPMAPVPDLTPMMSRAASSRIGGQGKGDGKKHDEDDSSSSDESDDEEQGHGEGEGEGEGDHKQLQQYDHGKGDGKKHDEDDSSSSDESEDEGEGEGDHKQLQQYDHSSEDDTSDDEDAESEAPKMVPSSSNLMIPDSRSSCSSSEGDIPPVQDQDQEHARYSSSSDEEALHHTDGSPNCSSSVRSYSDSDDDDDDEH